jgi:large subunit ribosomal protein L21e
MVKGRRIREKGKIRFSKYFQKLEDGTQVAVIRDLGVGASFPHRLQGRSGKIIGSRGSYKIISVDDGDKTKTFIIHPIHLRKM